MRPARPTSVTKHYCLKCRKRPDVKTGNMRLPPRHFSYLTMKSSSGSNCVEAQRGSFHQLKVCFNQQISEFVPLPVMTNSLITMSTLTNVPKTSVNLSPISRMVFEHSSTEKQIQSVAQSVAFMNKSEASEAVSYTHLRAHET